MNENLELLEYIYQNSEMGVFTLTKLLQQLNGKENKIKKVVEEELKGYEVYLKDSKKLIKKSKVDAKANGIMQKMGASMGIKKEVKVDNSDAAMAHMLVEGITMGVVDMKTKIKNYKDSVDKDVLRLAERFLKFQEDEIEILNAYL